MEEISHKKRGGREERETRYEVEVIRKVPRRGEEG